MLPENVMFEVLSRLPAKSITRCKGVCKEWLDTVSDPHFVRHHLSSRRRRVALMIHESTDKGLRNHKEEEEGTLKWVEMERKYPQFDKFKKWRQQRGDSLTIHPVKTLDFKLGGIAEIGSVNGLVSYWAHSKFIYILNPVLEEYITLPLPPFPVVDFVYDDYYAVTTLGYGFGVSSTTKEYKVIRIRAWWSYITTTTKVCTFVIEVYTIGGQWRRITISTPNNLDFNGGQPGVYVNSHLYWLGDHGQIYGFDLTTEEMMSELLFPNPNANPDYYCYAWRPKR
ncbi:hypothetical protein SSX86_017476 [Deinandra increscens subsp. villosa]|uniref:F-box domain-containing protein n=1 Tax=Deinandra increscens subsp. villosa TaxID=3103831 RepID=A0AAP0CZZ0_9ASTR